MIKKIMTIAVVLVASSALADSKLVDCRVAKIYDDNVFEEGLSTHEYPEVDLTQNAKNLSLSVGSMQNYETKNGDSVSYKKQGGKILIEAKYKDSEDLVFIEVTNNKTEKGDSWGRLKVKQEGESVKPVALLICK